MRQFRMLLSLQQRFVRLLHHLAGDRPCRHRTIDVQRRTAHVDQRFNRDQQGDQFHRQAHGRQHNQRSKGCTATDTGHTG
ncbi:hypothetical protein D3C79_1069680 [compost metagenome]